MDRRLGARGESRTAGFLKRKGYQILEKNFKSRLGEVDIVAKRDDTIVFVEVKTWTAMPFSALEHAISTAKQRRIVSAARLYLQRHPETAPLHIRFDVVFLRGDREDGFEHLEGAFEPT